MLSKAGRTKESIQVLEPLAKVGDSEAQWYLFQTYANATPPYTQLADRWLKQSAAGGNTKAIAVLKHGRDAQPDQEGKVKTQALVGSIRAMIADKIAGFSDKTVD